MKHYIIINGTQAWVIKRKSMKEARKAAENTCDLSLEVIVRELKHFTIYSKEFTIINDF